MLADAALLFLSVATVLFISAQSTCGNPVHCSCGNTGEHFTTCVGVQNETDPCTRWKDCRRCHEGHSASKGNCSEDIESPKLGIIRCEASSRRKTCTGTCVPGYTFEKWNGVAEMVLSCQDGRWTPSRSFPPCVSGGYCDLVAEHSSQFNCSKGMQGTRCDVFCSARYEGRFLCYPGRPWEPPLPLCVRPKVVAEKLTCDDPGFIVNGYRRHLDGTDSRVRRTFQGGESLLFGCRSEDYALVGPTFITCRNGLWSESLPRCIGSKVSGRVYCENPGPITNGRIQYFPPAMSGTTTSISEDDIEFPEGTRLEYSCKNGYALLRSNFLICLNTNRWSSNPPICLPELAESPDRGAGILFCSDPGGVLNGNRAPAAAPNRLGFLQSSRLEYSCNQGYVLQGEKSLFCMVGGRWSSAKPTCGVSGRVYCENPGPITNGRIQYFPPAMSGTTTSISEDDTEFPEGTRLEYSCKNGYAILGSYSLICLNTSRWSSNPPICLQVCGFSTLTDTRIFNGTRSGAGDLPWVVSIRRDNESRIVCGGAVLNSRTVVTAAHCLTDSDSYLLYFGKIQKLDRNDDDEVLVMRSSRIILHPNYSTETGMESDIGLVHVSPSIQFSVRVQPICLPDDSTTARNLMTGSMGFVAGFGENERQVQPNELMQARIPVQDNEVCVEYYRQHGIALVMSENMFCAGYPGGDQATCQGDSGSPLVFLDEDAERFTVEGLVSFATNGQCGVQGRYTVFTKVRPFVPWLLANLA